MKDNFLKNIGAINRVYQESEVIRQIVRMNDQMGGAMRLFEFQRSGIGRALEISGTIGRVLEMATVNKHLQRLAEQSAITSRMGELTTDIHKTWLGSIGSVQSSLANLQQIQASAKLSLGCTIHRFEAAEKLVSGVNLGTIGSRYQVKMSSISELGKSIGRVYNSYGRFTESLQDIPDIMRLPSFVLPGATREILTTGVVLKALQVWEEEEQEEEEAKLIDEVRAETSNCIFLLQQFDPGLARIYIGAREAFSGNNPDRTRHVLSSLRELWNHLLWQLAPNEHVITWIEQQTVKKDLLHEDKPTRRARILYICREINSGPFSEFMTHDTMALLKLYALFNRIHEPEIGLTDKQVQAIFLRVDSFIMNILQISMVDLSE
ncbi:MAG: hypothetical protein AB7F25_02740 [Deferribacterales bacterium]